jgi:hypothetical protein
MKLKHLTLNKIVDACYACGIARTPVAVILAAPSGTGKTWATEAITDQSDIPFVQYITGAMSATSHRKKILALADYTRLIIHDDIGMCSRFEQEQIFSTYMMITSGKIEFEQYKTMDYKKIDSSVLICCTVGYWADHLRVIEAKGLLDRMLPVVIGLSEETRKSYQRDLDIFNTDAPKRLPEIADQHSPLTEIFQKQDVSPRWMRNISKISQFLTEEEVLELIAVLERPMRYEV